jgi:Uma2 family endonuclease
MQQIVEIPKLTYQDYCALPDDGKRYEIIDGDLFVTPSPVTKHQRAARNLLFLIEGYLRNKPLGELLAAPFDVILDDHTIVAPDLVYVRSENRQVLTDKNIQGAPDLVIEILSPSTARMDRVLKLRKFAERGVAHYWIVDPAAETLEAMELAEGTYRMVFASDVKGVFEPSLFPGLRIPIREIFR